MDLIVARAIRRKSQWDLRQETGIHQSKISLFERGHVTPSPEEKLKIANALGFNVSEISWEQAPCGNQGHK